MNKFIFHSDGSAVLALRRRDGTTLPCVIDAVDYELVKGHHWHAQKDKHTFYVVTNVHKPDGKRTLLSMHSLLLPDAKRVDHEDGNGLNNRRTNLRTATHAENMRNRRKHKNGVTSQYRGASWDKSAGKFRAQIMVNGKKHFLGLFSEESDAARAYNVAALQCFGEFARLNFPPQQLLKAA